MKKEKIEKILAACNGAETSYPFGPDALVYKVMGKMFALVSQTDTPPRITLKGAPEDNAMLVGQFQSVVPGYYMNKKHWITITLTGDLEDEMVENLCKESYQLVVNKLTKNEKSVLKEL